MNSWRDGIVNEFTINVSRLTLAADPDGLVLEEGVSNCIRENGFDVLVFEDPIAFRYAYEKKFRLKWDSGKTADVVVVFQSAEGDLNSLPYDLLQTGRRLLFTLGDIFPNLCYPIVADLDKVYLDELYSAQRKHAPGPLGDNATKEFILRHVFEIAPELIKQPSDLLRALLRRHYRGQDVPMVLDERLIHLLRQNDIFDGWPLEVIIPDRELFFRFLQERWPLFLNRFVVKETISEDLATFGITIPGPAEIPFEHDDIRVYIDNFFRDGLLKPIDVNHSLEVSESWIKAGVNIDPDHNLTYRIDRLIKTIESSIPDKAARHGDWVHFAFRWAELLYLILQTDIAIYKNDDHPFAELRNRIDNNFIAWTFKRYASLINLPPVPPAMLHHIPRYLFRRMARDKNERIALVVIDGLALDQWILVRETFNSRHTDFLFRESAVFAWIPTLTSISRQAIFAGKPPVFFPDTILTTAKEPALWTQFWSDHGLMQKNITYAKESSTFTLNTRDIQNLLDDANIKAAGIVVNKVDKIMHGMMLGSSGMHNQVKQWVGQNDLENLFNILLNLGYTVFVTSDHGNIEADGCGQLKEGVIADIRGQRVRIYNDETLRRQAGDSYSGSLLWEPLGLPEDCLPLIAPARSAYIAEKKKSVAHGGISIEEVIVPFVQVERGNN